MRSTHARTITTMVLLCLALVLSSCGQTGSQDATTIPTSIPTKQIQVVATTTHLADFARVLLGSRGTVHCILRAGDNPHAHELSPADVTAIANADVTLVNGAGLDTWLTDRWPTLDHQGIFVDTSRGIAVRNSNPLGGGEIDPHIWMNPQNAKLMVATIREALSKVDADGSATYGANERAYIAQLQVLSNELQSALTPMRSFPFLVSHDALGYFGAQYNLVIVGSVTGGYSGGKALDAAARQALLDAAKAKGAKAIFMIDDFTGPQSSAIAQTLRIPVVGNESPIRVDSLGAKDSGADTYLTAMRRNAEVFVRALG